MKKRSIYFGLSCLATVAPVLASADSVRIYRDDVIPVVMRTELSLRDNQSGDRFTAEVTDSSMLPKGTKLEGRVERVTPNHNGRHGYMDIAFTTIILPDGRRQTFHGTPIALSKDYVTRDRFGRWEAKKGVKKETAVLGATAGGLILGAMIKKPFEGAFLGALAGIVLGETDKDHIGDGDIVVPKGAKVGARVDEDRTLPYDGRWDPREDRDGGYDHEGFNSAGYDDHGYDRQGRYSAKYDIAKEARHADRATDDNGRSQDRDDYEVSPNSSRDMRIEIDGHSMRYTSDLRPFRSDSFLMVPLDSTATQLGIKVTKDRYSDSITLDHEDDVLRLEQESLSYRLNDRRGSLPTGIEVRSGNIFVPIEVFAMLRRGSVYVDGMKYKLKA